MAMLLMKPPPSIVPALLTTIVFDHDFTMNIRAEAADAEAARQLSTLANGLMSHRRIELS